MSRTLTLTAFACATLGSLALTGCGDQRELEYKEVEIQELRRQNKELENELAKRESGKAADSIATSKAAGADDLSTTRAAMDGQGVTVGSRDHQQEIVIALDNAILFKSGSATLSTQAKGVLAKAATVLNKQYPGDLIRVVGHTDDEKITRSKHAFDDNWDLAGGRARAVRAYLQERGVDVSRMTFEGCADQRPLVANSNDANRAKNRRVEIIVLPSTGAAKPSAK